MFLLGIRPHLYQLRSGMSVNRYVHTILDCREEIARRVGCLVVIDRRRIQVGNLLVEFALAQPDFAYSRKQVLEIFVAERRAIL